MYSTTVNIQIQLDTTNQGDLNEVSELLWRLNTLLQSVEAPGEAQLLLSDLDSSSITSSEPFEEEEF